MMWCMKRTNIYLGDEQTEQLDRIAAEEGVSRAEIIRRLIDRALAGGQDDLAADLAAIDDSFGALRDIDQPVRVKDERDEHLARMWQIAA
jgi:Arc/MetJ-type ribon-helix-helix transcriptional regulator